MTYAIGLAVICAAIFAFIRLRNRPFAPKKGWQHYGIVGGKMRSINLTAPSFDFGEPHYMTKDCSGLSGSIRVKWRFTGDVFPVEQPGAQPLLSVHFQRKGDNWTAQGKYGGYRFYSRLTFPLVAGEHEAVIALVPDEWGNVWGSQDGFAEALRNASRVGLVFGWSGGRGHGVAGSGRFELLEFEG